MNLKDTQGLYCPCCKKADLLYIAARVMVRVDPDGVETSYPLEYDWDTTAFTECSKCKFSASVMYFSSAPNHLVAETKLLVKEYKHAVKVRAKSEIKHQQRVIKRISQDFTPDQI